MKRLFTSATQFIKRKDVEKDKEYSNHVNQEKVKRNIEVAEERLEDPNLTMCQRQEYQKALDGLQKYNKD